MNFQAPKGSHLWRLFMWAHLAQMANAELSIATGDLAPKIAERDRMENYARKALDEFMSELGSNRI